VLSSWVPPRTHARPFRYLKMGGIQVNDMGIAVVQCNLGGLSPDTADAMDLCRTYSMRRNIPIIDPPRRIKGSKVIPFAREQVNQFVLDNYHGATHILNVDDDMVFPPDTLEKLLSYDKDIVGVLYTGRTKPWLPQIFKKVDGKFKHWLFPPGNDVFQADAVGFGLTLIKRQVFEQLSKPWFQFYLGDKGEDLYFCEKAKDAGFEIWVDGTSEYGHMGEHMFTMKFYNEYIKSSQGRFFLDQIPDDEKFFDRKEEPAHV